MCASLVGAVGRGKEEGREGGREAESFVTFDFHPFFKTDTNTRKLLLASANKTGNGRLDHCLRTGEVRHYKFLGSCSLHKHCTLKALSKDREKPE